MKLSSKLSGMGAAALVVSAMTLCQAQASVIVSEDFNYSAGELNGQGSATGGWAGGWSANAGATQITTPGLSFTRADGVVHNGGSGKLELQGPNVQSAASRDFAAASVYNGSVFYVSMLIKVDGTLQNNDFAAGWFNQYDGLGIGLKANGGSGSTTFDIFARARLDGNNAAYAQNLVMGQTYLIVGRFSKNGASTTYNQADLWVNPIFASIAAPDASISQSGVASSIRKFGFRVDGLDTPSVNPDVVNYDMLRIGTEWADVMPVPEPTTILSALLLFVPFTAGALRMFRRGKAQ